ncbi:MAG TPA: T9SS type A sorting domain-containing protein [Bacteroidia bacterium]|nr:T9SS type A sorting domain-containing protein [Bacteroidia bacterium]
MKINYSSINVLLIYLLSSFDWCFAQTNFQKIITQQIASGGYSIFPTNDNHYIYSPNGNGSLNSGIGKVGLSKLDSLGNLIWSKTYYETSIADSIIANVLMQTNDGNYLIAGNYNSSGQHGILLMKSDTSGNILWTNRINGGLQFYTYNLYLAPNGNFYLTTLSTGTVSTPNSIFYMDQNGNIIWKYTYWFGALGSYGNYGCVMPNNQLHIISSTINSIYISRLDSNGTPLGEWNINFPTGFNVQFPNPSYITRTTDNGNAVATNVVVGGNKVTSIIKIDSLGNVQWSKLLDTAKFHCKGIICTGDSNIVVATQYLSSEIAIFKIGLSGNIISAKSRIFSFINIRDIKNTMDNGFIIKTIIDSLGNSYVAKADAAHQMGCYQNYAYHDSIFSASAISNVSQLYSSFTTNTIASSFTFLNSADTQNTDCVITDMISSEVNSSTFLISPNPATTELTINFSKAARYNVQLCNTLGEVLEQAQTNSATLSLNISNKPKGIYFITVTDEAGNKAVRKIVKM